MVAEPLRAEDLPSAAIEADERPIGVGVIAVGDARLAAVPPLRFDVAFDANSGVYELTGEFDIVLASPTRRELEDALDDTLALLSKGFQPLQGRHRRFIHFTTDGKKTPVWTMLSHGSRREFDDLVACPLSRDQYEAKLRDADAI